MCATSTHGNGFPKKRKLPLFRPISTSGLDSFGPFNTAIGRSTEKRYGHPHHLFYHLSHSPEASLFSICWLIFNGVTSIHHRLRPFKHHFLRQWNYSSHGWEETARGDCESELKVDDIGNYLSWNRLDILATTQILTDHWSALSVPTRNFCVSCWARAGLEDHSVTF